MGKIFKPRARLLLQLGNQLIRNESIAILELVKNAYDADATLVTISMQEIDNPAKGIIVIEDNGVGMDMGIITDVWMEPGSDYKQKLVEAGERSREYDRIPLGEKGIGRFAIHKLGKELELVTRAAKSKEVVLEIDWTDFETARYLEDVPIRVYEREPEIFKGKQTGTRIIARNLRKAWTRGMFRDVYRSAISLCSPFERHGSFQVEPIKIDREDWLEGLMTWKQLIGHALFKFNCEIEGRKITRFRYQFTPWPSMRKLEPRTISEKDEFLRKKLLIEDGKEKEFGVIDFSRFHIGKIKFEGYIFDRDPRILKLSVQDKRGLKTYLNQNGGVRVFRDGIRVYDYGEQENDWLELDIRRVNIPAKRVSNNIIIGAVSLDRESSSDLEEKTNREGFIENEAYRTFRRAVLYALDQVEILRYEDKEILRMHYGPKPKTEPVVSKIDQLKETVKEKIQDEPLKTEIVTYLERIEEDYITMNEILLKSAGAGLNLSVVIHEIEKVIEELEKLVEQEKVGKRIKELVNHLSRLVEGYSMLIRKGEKETLNLGTIVNQAVLNMKYRFRVHKVEILTDFSSYCKNPDVKCVRSLVASSIMNIFDNSIYWLRYAKRKIKKIYIKISEEISDFLSIVIADNGIGFTLPVEQITKPFVSAKPDGMGLGLHIAKEVMEAHGGEILFPEWGDFSLPEEFRKGAIIALAFRREVRN